MMRRKVWFSLGVIILTAAIGTTALYTRDIARIRARLAEASTLITTRHGPVEVSVRGDGPVVLVLHGAGGGYDQGLLLARMFGGEGKRFVAVSRFGYLRSPLPTDPSTLAQAEALADVLDALGEDRAALLAMSGGVPPALQFAARFPERTRALALLSSAPFSPLTAASQDLPMPAWAYQTLFANDFPIWAITRIAPTALDPAFDLTPALRENLTPTEARDVDALLAGFLPVAARLPGLANEAAAIDPSVRYALDRITAPVLIAHARDDGINPFPIGQYLADQLPDAHFVVVAEGGHLLLGHHAALRAAIAAHFARAP